MLDSTKYCDAINLTTLDSIQDYGALVIVDNDLKITHYSENIFKFINLADRNLMDKTLFDLFEFSADLNSTNLLKIIANKKYFFTKTKNGLTLVLSFHRKIEQIIVEIEQLDSKDYSYESATEVMNYLVSLQQTLRLYDTLDEIAQLMVETIRDFVGFDRVVIYRFNKEYSGTVIAESVIADLENYLGLRFPASDIPEPVRKMYLNTKIRYIPNVDYVPQKIFSLLNDGRLDISNATMRAVSPVHVEYMKNMGIATSTSIPIIVENELWGIISCHNIKPKYLNIEMRNLLILMGEFLTSSFQFHYNLNKHLESFKIAAMRGQLNYLFTKTLSEIDLKVVSKVLLEGINANGIAFITQNKITCFGNTPSIEELNKLLIWIKQEHPHEIYFTDSLPLEFPDAENFKSEGCGLLVCPLNENELILFFKPETLQEIAWAGNPNEALIVKENIYSPRASFKQWIEIVRNHSERWNDNDIIIANLLQSLYLKFKE